MTKDNPDAISHKSNRITVTNISTDYQQLENTEV